MARTSIFGTKRPDIGTIIKYDTPGQNETQLDEDQFEKKIIEHFDKNSTLSYERIVLMVGLIISSGEAADYIRGINRADDLMESMVSANPNKYKQVSKGYIKLSEN